MVNFRGWLRERERESQRVRQLTPCFNIILTAVLKGREKERDKSYTRRKDIVDRLNREEKEREKKHN